MDNHSVIFAPPTARELKSVASVGFFRIIVISASVGISLVLTRSVLFNQSIASGDVACLAILVLSLICVSLRPGWLLMLSWIVFLSLVANIFDGLSIWTRSALTPTHMFLPALVLYGALMGSWLLGAVGSVVLIGIYTAALVQHWPVSAVELLSLSNLTILALVLGVAAFGVWQKHRQIFSTLEAQSRELRSELDVNVRLINLISHDIANPLSVLTGYIDCLDSPSSSSSGAHVQTIRKMAKRIGDIIGSVRELQQVRGADRTMETVTVKSLHEDLVDLFGSMLRAKQQSLVLVDGGSLSVLTSSQIVVHSILGNFLSNAIKFSPRGGDIELAASRVDPRIVRIELRDRGAGIDAQSSEALHLGLPRVSRRGTHGEPGNGSGLRIAQLCAIRLGGRLSLRERAGGGTIAAVELPAALAPDPKSLSASDYSSAPV